jgi:uncharacterized membrane protein
VVGYGLLLTAATGSGPYVWGGLMAGTIVMAGAVVTRQVLTVEKHRRLAITDHVTGLSNRAGLFT